MPRGSFAPEIRTAMGTGKPGRVNTSLRKENPADLKRDKAAGIKEGSPQDEALDAMPQNMQRPSAPQRQTMPGVVHSTPPDAHHVAAATSIAHAILARRGGQ
jgi:hypothetical protein